MFNMSNQSTPLVSIIIPIYNVAPYLSECIQSVLTQSYENLDIILIDDGSSDESLEIALEFAKKDKRIFVISKPNGGQATARNYGMEFIKGSALREFFDSCHTERSEVSHIQSLSQTHSFAKTYKSLSIQEIQSHFKKIQPNFITSDLERINDFITQELPKDALIHFIDSDDYIQPHCIELCVQNLLTKDLDIFVHNWSDFDEETKTLSKGAYMGQLKKNSYESGLELLSHNKIYNFFFTPQGLFRANILNHYTLRYTEGIYHEDHDFGTLLFALAKRSAYSDEALYVYRKRAGSTMNAKSAMPPKLPSFLEPLRKDFDSYKEMRAYFKAYCFVVVGFRLWEVWQLDSLNKRRRQYFKKSIKKCYVGNFFNNFFNKESVYSLKAREMLVEMGYGDFRFWYFYFLVRSYWRNPKKFLRLFGFMGNAKS